MRRYKRILFFVVLCVLGACTENLRPDSPVESDLPLEFSAAPVVPVSKAIDPDIVDGDNKFVVSDFWVFQYNVNGSLIGKPAYYRFSGNNSVSILKPSADNISYTTVFIANTHDNSLGNKIDCRTMSSLMSSAKMLGDYDDLYQQSYDDLILSGVVEVTNATETIDCKLYRNVAKLVLTIDNQEGSGIIINSVQLKNISNKLFYADHLYPYTETEPSLAALSFFDFEKESLNIASGVPATTLNYYLSRNMRGQNSAAEPKDKNLNPPPYSSYIEVMATHEQRGTLLRYIFYLGKNSTNDFNLEPNYLYNVSLSFNGMGASDDNRVEDLSEIELADANSYVINPYSTNIGIKYVVPAAERINKFWNHTAGKQDANRNYLHYLLAETNEIVTEHGWVAEVLWQDVPGKQVIKFCQNDGSLSDTYMGTVEDASFSFALTEDAQGVEGNILIGVRSGDPEWDEAKDGYMWSWHIWLTGYDPYYKVGEWKQDFYSYEVTGGHLHKYVSFETKDRYTNKYSMDRNLGATRADAPDPTLSNAQRLLHMVQASGLFYQFGRKDPFPSGDYVDVYNIKGEQISMEDPEAAPQYILHSVQKPLTYFTSNGAWEYDNKWSGNDWNDIRDNPAKGGDGKSFFDPCPPGWKIPHHEIWRGFTNETVMASKSVFAYNCYQDPTTGKFWDNTSYNKFTEYGGWLIYLAGKSAWDAVKVRNEADNYELAYFPASGMRNYGGKQPSVGGASGLWSAIPGSAANGNYLYYDNKYAEGHLFSHPRAFHRALGFPVRCIQE